MEREILIVASDAHLRRALGRLCRDQGCRVEAVRSIAMAWNIMDRIPIRVLIADVSVQNEREGVELAHVIHDRNTGANCFLIVNGESSNFVGSTEDTPWLRFFHKPIPMLRFASDIAEAITKSREHDQPAGTDSIGGEDATMHATKRPFPSFHRTRLTEKEI
jgi:DNA-binding NtrC family response regulator